MFSVQCGGEEAEKMNYLLHDWITYYMIEHDYSITEFFFF